MDCFPGGIFCPKESQLPYINILEIADKYKYTLNKEIIGLINGSDFNFTL